MTEEFKNIIDADINRCEKALNGEEDCYRLYYELFSKYSPIITDFSKKLVGVFDYKDYIPNIKIMKSKLELFKAMEYKNMTDNAESGIIINNNNANSNVIDINISFEQARKSIEDMTVLPDSEVEEILSKMDELEKIMKSNERKTKKWENAKEIVKWIADKGVDVALTFIPLLLQMK